MHSTLLKKYKYKQTNTTPAPLAQCGTKKSLASVDRIDLVVGGVVGEVQAVTKSILHTQAFHSGSTLIISLTLIKVLDNRTLMSISCFNFNGFNIL